MGKIRRGGFIFVTWVGDHGKHVHVFRNQREVLKWDLETDRAIQGTASRRLVRLIRELREEGVLR